MVYDSCGILLTENCNAKCKMCCDSRGTVCGKTLSKQEIDLILSNIKAIKDITTVGVTGGEPMLYQTLVEYILNYNFGRDVRFTLKSNGFWGKNIENTTKFIKKYRTKISMLSFSFDEFHKEFVDLQSIKNIIEIADDFEVNSEVVGCFLKDGMQPHDVLKELGEYAFKTNFAYQPVIKTGAAKSFFNDSQFCTIFNVNKHNPRCLTLLDKTLLVTPNLDVYPCCSQVIENTLLLMGNLKKESLSDIINSIKYNRILNMIFTEGFRPFLKLLSFLDIEYPTKLSSACELCEYLFRDDWFLKLLERDKYFDYL